MLRYGRSTQNAVAAISCLAEAYESQQKRLSAADIAQSRRLPKPFVAKLLTTLSQARLVRSSPGPGGGYVLAKPPSAISLLDIVVLFERDDENQRMTCPFGLGPCQASHPGCPMHDNMLKLDQQMNEFLRSTFLDSLVKFKPVAEATVRAMQQAVVTDAADDTAAPPCPIDPVP